MRRGLCAVALLLGASAGSAGAVDGVPDMRIRAVVTGDGLRPPERSAKQEGSLVETIYISGDRVRVDFDGGPHMRGRLLRNGERAWLLRPPSHVVLPASRFRIGLHVRMDPRRPCWDSGLSCHRTASRTIAGRPAQGYRYRHAGQQGPFGTDQGTFWIDAEYGVVLAFKGRDLGDKDYRMQVLSIQPGPLPKSTFRRP